MIRVSVMANDSVLVDVIAAILAREIRLDLLQLSYCLPRSIYRIIHDHRSVVILIDEGDYNSESMLENDPFFFDNPLLVIKTCLKSRNIYIFETYQLGKPGMDQMVERLRDLDWTWLQKREEIKTSLSTHWRKNDQRAGAGERITLC
jgi:hypothetical protein